MHLRWLFPLALLGGCATVRPQASFPEVAQDVAAQTQLDMRWRDGSAADVEMDRRVAALLAAPLSADSAAQVALLNNRHLQATYESLGVAQADLVGAGLLKNPVFDGSIRFGEGGASPTIDLGIAFDFVDLLFIGARKRIAAAELEASKAEVTAAVLNTASAAKVAYFELHAAQQRLELQRQAEQATAASAALAERLRAAGNTRALDLAQERVLHEEAAIAVEAANDEVTQRREALVRVLGVSGDAVAHLAINGRLPDPTGDEPTVSEDEAVRQSLALRRTRAETSAALARLGVTRPLGLLSDIELGASAERDEGNWEVGPAVALPIPIFSQGQPAVAAARARVRQAIQQYQAAVIDVRSHAREQAARVRSLRQQLDRYRTTILPLRETVARESQLQYNAMQIGGFELIAARREQLLAADAYLDLLRDYWIARMNLQLTLSGGDGSAGAMNGAMR